MSAQILLGELHARGIRLAVTADKLRYEPVSAATPELVERIKTHKAELIALLAPKPQTHAEREIARFERVAVPTANGWCDVSCRRSIDAMNEELRRQQQDPGRPFAPGEPMPCSIPPGWSARGWQRELRWLANAMAELNPKLATHYRAVADGTEDLRNDGRDDDHATVAKD